MTAEEMTYELYEKGKSMAEISDILTSEFSDKKWYPMKVQRMLKKGEKLGLIEVRDYKEAQKLSVDKGKYKHPTAGRKRTDEEKDKIRNGIDRYISEMSDDERAAVIKARVDGHQKRWNSLTEKERQSILEKMKTGQTTRLHAGMSKFEELLYLELKARGWNVLQKHNIDNKGTEIDLFVQNKGKKYAIEIDGPTHFMPIYGEEALQKTIEKDESKNQILLGAKFKLLRFRTNNNHSKRAVSISADRVEKWIKNGKDYEVLEQ